MTIINAILTVAQRAAGALGLVSSDTTSLLITSVQAGTFPIYIGGWAGRPSATSNTGAEIITTDFGRIRWYSDGAQWRLASPTDLLVDLTASTVGVASTSEQVLKQFTFPAGMLQSLRYFSVKPVWIRSGATDATTIRLRLGSVGTIADPLIITNAAMTGTGRSLSTETVLNAISATQIRLTAHQTGALAWAGATTSVTYPQTTTVSNMASGASILSLTAQMAGATDTPQVAHLIVTGY